jgi:hypothetical protein
MKGVRLFWFATLGIALAITIPSAAGASTVTPINDSIVTRVGTVLPLDASGSQIAFSATSTDGGYLGDSIWVANGDGSNMRRVAGSDAGVSDLTESGDHEWLAYQAPGFITDQGVPVDSARVGVVNVSTGALSHISFRGLDQTDAIVAGPSWFYATKERGPAIRLDPGSGQGEPVPLVGGGASTPGGAQAWTSSEDREQVGFCSAGKVKNVRRTLGILDTAAGVVRTTRAALRGWSGCQVSNDGSTIATVGFRGKTPRLFVFRHATTSLIPIGAKMRMVVALSPSGRYAVVQSGNPVEAGAGGSSGARVAIVDLNSRHLVRLRGVDGTSGYVGANSNLTAATAWSHDERKVVIVAASWRKHGRAGSSAAARLVVVSTGTGAAHALARPVAPRGIRFDGAPVPQAFTDDGRGVGVTVPTTSHTTDAVPYRVPLKGRRATLLFSSSVRSFGSLARSPDKSRAWIAAGWTCRSSYRYPMMSIAGHDPWGSPWQVRS